MKLVNVGSVSMISERRLQLAFVNFTCCYDGDQKGPTPKTIEDKFRGVSDAQ